MDLVWSRGCCKRLLESEGPGLESEKQLQGLDAAAADFVELGGSLCRSCRQHGHIAREYPDWP